MTVFQQVREEVARQPAGTILTFEDFSLPVEQMGALAKALSRLQQQGALRRLVKGLYYKPKQSVLGFGDMETPFYGDLLFKLLDLYKDKVSYMTGVGVYAAMSLTTQISREFVIATDRPRSPIKVGMTEVRFVRSHVTVAIPESDISLVQLLDALWEIKEIPATTPTKAARVLRGQLRRLTTTQRQALTNYALKFYPPQTRALTGLMLESLGETALAQELKRSLNPLTVFRLALDGVAFPNTRSWNIL